MPTSAALLVAAQDCLDGAGTFAARHYWMGTRDAYESIFRGLHELRTGREVGVDAVREARLVLDQLNDDVRVALVAESTRGLRAKRASSVEITVALVAPTA
jgi:hypothetical protein